MKNFRICLETTICAGVTGGSLTQAPPAVVRTNNETLIIDVQIYCHYHSWPEFHYALSASTLKKELVSPQQNLQHCTYVQLLETGSPVTTPLGYSRERDMDTHCLNT